MKVCRNGFLVGFPISLLYAWSAVDHHPAVFGMLLFYGIGLGLGASIGLSGTEVIAVGVFFVSDRFLCNIIFNSILWSGSGVC